LKQNFNLIVLQRKMQKMQKGKKIVRKNEHCAPITPTYDDEISRASISIMAVRVVEFSNGGYKIKKIFA
jgi:hypothetical protein